MCGAELREAFSAFDTERTGEIEASHVAMAVRRLGMDFDTKHLQKAMKRASGSGGQGHQAGAVLEVKVTIRL